MINIEFPMHKLMKKVIINADDFGLSPGVNKGILSGFQEGILTSTTMLTNLQFFDDAVAIAKENPELPVGIHLSLLWGKSVSNPIHIRSLVDRHGCFPGSLTVFARRYFMGLISQDNVITEFRNQIKKFLDAGLEPTHIDTHKQIHCLPGILKSLISAASEFKIYKVRFPFENGIKIDCRPGRHRLQAKPWKAICKRNLLRFLCRNNRKILQDAGFKTTDNFVGIDYTDCLSSDVLYSILKNLKNGVTEIMCHPGFIDESLKEFSSIPPNRETELECLKDQKLKDYVVEHGIRLINYRDLSFNRSSRVYY